MTNEEKVEFFIKNIFEPVKDKPGYVWLNKRNFQITSIETLRKALNNPYKTEREIQNDKRNTNKISN